MESHGTRRERDVLVRWISTFGQNIAREVVAGYSGDNRMWKSHVTNARDSLYHVHHADV